MKLFWRYFPLAALLLTFALGVGLRLYRFDSLPYGLPHDGALEALEAIAISQKPLPYLPYSVANPWLGETLFRYVLAAFISGFGVSTYVIKLVSTLFGILTLLSFYLLARKLFSKQIALFSLFFLSVSGWHIIMGKTVWRAISLPFFECLGFYFFLLFLEKPNTVRAILAALSLALTLNTYNAARIIPVYLVVVFFFYTRNKLRQYWSQHKISLAVFILTLIVSLLPVVQFALKYPNIFNSRVDYLFIGNQIRQSQSLKPLVANLQKTVLMFNVRAGGDDFFVNEPLLEPPVSWLFILGLGVVIFGLSKFNHKFVLLGFLFSLLPGFLSVPNGNRDIGVLPFVYLLIGQGLEILWNLSFKFTKTKIIGVIVIGLVLICSLWSVRVNYFSSERREIFGFNPEAAQVGEYIRKNLKTTDFYLTDNYPRDTLTFMTYTGGDPYRQKYTWFENGQSFLSVVTQPQRNTAFVMFASPNNQSLLDELWEKYPFLNQEDLVYMRDGNTLFRTWILTVPAAEISK